jgi:hypothetical protein
MIPSGILTAAALFNHFDEVIPACYGWYYENEGLPAMARYIIGWLDDYFWHDLLFTVLILALGIILYCPSKVFSKFDEQAEPDTNVTWPPPPNFH